jgi:hypothetical protein
MTAGRIVTGVLLLVIGAALGWFVHALGWLQLSTGGPVSKQVPGDPPVTVSDGSVHAHSPKGWVTPDPDASNHTIIQPLSPTGDGSSGTFFAGSDCANAPPSGTAQTPGATAFLWTDDGPDTFYDISPPASGQWTVVITDSNANAVTVSYPNITASTPKPTLLIKASQGGFDAVRSGDNDENNREYSVPAVVRNIKVTGAAPVNGNKALGASGWTPSSHNHPHFTLGFCYH